MKTRVGSRNHVLDGGAYPQKEGAIFGGSPGYSKELAIFAAPVAAASLQKATFNRRYRHAEEAIIQYARQAQIIC